MLLKEAVRQGPRTWPSRLLHNGEEGPRFALHTTNTVSATAVALKRERRILRTVSRNLDVP